MLSWITNRFKRPVPNPPKPKCAKCGLGAVYVLNITMHRLTTEDNKTSITSLLCESCKDKVNMTYNPKWLPPPVLWRN